jgi:hypothetical protein
MYFAEQLAGEDPLQHATGERLCSAARLVEQAAPWEWMEASPIVAVQLQPGAEPDFVAVRGGEHAVCVYPGMRGLSWLRELQHSDGEARKRLLLTGREALEVRFDDRSRMDARDLPLLDACWCGDGGATFRSVRRGYWPWFVNEHEARRLTGCLEALAALPRSVPESPTGLPLLQRDSSGRWSAQWKEVRMHIDSPSRPPLIDTPPGPRTGALCVGDRIVPGEIDHATERPPVLHVVAAVEAGTGDPYPIHLRPPGERWSNAVRRVVAGAIRLRAAVPERILAPDPGWSLALHSLAIAAGFAVQLAGPLPELDGLFGDWDFGAGTDAVH